MNRFLTRTLPLSALTALVYSFLFQMLYNSMRYSVMWPYPDIMSFVVSFLYNFFPFWFTIIVVWLIIFRCPIGNSATTKIIIDIIATATWVVALNITFVMVMVGMKVDWAGTIFNAVLIFVVIEAIYFWSKFRDSLIRESQYREEALMNRYRTLRMQINPHFLFNSLNILNSLITIDTQKSREFINSLSKLYRYIMSNEGNDTILLSEEISFMHSYLHVLRIRYLDKLYVEVKDDNPDKASRVVAYTLQLLLENIIKHNSITSAHPMHVDITIGQNCMQVKNQLRKKPVSNSSGLGLVYLKEMYSRFGLEFSYLETEDSFTVNIPYIQ